jgi:cystathionine beta-lyase/cystathionine gamma-synthase
MTPTKRAGLDTLAIHAGQVPDPLSGAVMQPIVLSSTFAQKSPGQHQGYEYSRSGNPTRKALEECIAALEGGRFGLGFASGLAATSSLFHLLSPGDHVLCGDDVYGGTFRLLDKVMAPFGIEASYAAMPDAAAVKAALRPNTKMIWMETPTNPLLKIFDIAATAEIARERRITLAVDNTFATPMLQRPLDLGATVVVHSSTKYLNGHSDIVGGVVVTSDEGIRERLAFLQNATGSVPSPFDCYMVLRGLKTLGVRMRAHVAAAELLAERLSRHARVDRVIYPGLASHPGRALAEKQMKGFGGMISFEVKGGLEPARRLLERLEIFACAESLGGVESLAEHPAIMTHASIPPEKRAALGISDSLVRLSVGLEDAEDLWADLQQALASG